MRRILVTDDNKVILDHNTHSNVWQYPETEDAQQCIDTLHKAIAVVVTHLAATVLRAEATLLQQKANKMEDRAEASAKNQKHREDLHTAMEAAQRTQSEILLKPPSIVGWSECAALKPALNEQASLNSRVMELAIDWSKKAMEIRTREPFSFSNQIQTELQLTCPVNPFDFRAVFAMFHELILSAPDSRPAADGTHGNDRNESLPVR